MLTEQEKHLIIDKVSQKKIDTKICNEASNTDLLYFYFLRKCGLFPKEVATLKVKHLKGVSSFNLKKLEDYSQIGSSDRIRDTTIYLSPETQELVSQMCAALPDDAYILQRKIRTADADSPPFIYNFLRKFKPFLSDLGYVDISVVTFTYCYLYDFLEKNNGAYDSISFFLDNTHSVLSKEIYDLFCNINYDGSDVLFKNKLQDIIGEMVGMGMNLKNNSDLHSQLERLDEIQTIIHTIKNDIK